MWLQTKKTAGFDTLVAYVVVRRLEIVFNQQGNKVK